MTKQFTVISISGNLDVAYPIGTEIQVVHNAHNQYSPVAMEAIDVNGNRIGLVSQNVLAESTEPADELFAIMKDNGQLRGGTCIVTAHEELSVGMNKKMTRTVLIINPL